MLSVNNAAVLSGLQALSQATTALNKAETAVSTGKSVSTASDNPAIYSIANTMQAQSSALTGISQGLNVLGQVVQTASAQGTLINNALTSLAANISEGQNTGIDTSTINTQISQTLTQIDSMASSATFNGVNLLAGALVSGVNYNTASTSLDVYGGTLKIAGNNATSAGLGLSGLNVDQAGVTIPFDPESLVIAGPQTTTLTLHNIAQATGTGTAQDPAVQYQFVAEESDTGANNPGTSTLATINTAIGGGADLQWDPSTGDLTSGTNTVITSQYTDPNGVKFYTLNSGEAIQVSQGSNGNPVYTVSSAFDALGNPTAQSVITPVTITSAGSGKMDDEAISDTFMTAISGQGFHVDRSSTDGALTISGGNIYAPSLSSSPSVSALTNAINTAPLSGHIVAVSSDTKTVSVAQRNDDGTLAYDSSGNIKTTPSTESFVSIYGQQVSLSSAQASLADPIATRMDFNTNGTAAGKDGYQLVLNQTTSDGKLSSSQTIAGSLQSLVDSTPAMTVDATTGIPAPSKIISQSGGSTVFAISTTPTGVPMYVSLEKDGTTGNLTYAVSSSSDFPQGETQNIVAVNVTPDMTSPSTYQDSLFTPIVDTLTSLGISTASSSIDSGTLSIVASGSNIAGSLPSGTVTADDGTPVWATPAAPSVFSNIQHPYDSTLDTYLSVYQSVPANSFLLAADSRNFSGSTITGQQVSGYQVAIGAVTAAISKMTSINANLGDSTDLISQLTKNTAAQQDAITTGISALTDADLAKQSVLLLSAQTKQQLAVQSLSIMDGQSSMILKLFQG
ncbi:flagellin [Gluconobacter oxydans]|uniref:flagellin N-terminal helical domain-containing protein n=2 Tax=Gluconobacter oxydans TaxID=442 RepID=UPI0039EB552D